MSFKLDTGRTHQIRVHCAHINHPILGDPLYGRCKKLPCKLEGQALHAIKLGLIHPINGKEMIFEAELPLDFQKLLNVLKVNSRFSDVFIRDFVYMFLVFEKIVEAFAFINYLSHFHYKQSITKSFYIPKS